MTPAYPSQQAMAIIVPVGMVLALLLCFLTWAPGVVRKLMRSCRWRRRHLDDEELLNTQASSIPPCNDAEIARLVLRIMKGRRAEHRAAAESLMGLFGFQHDSCENQLEHFESLLFWALTQSLSEISDTMSTAAYSMERMAYATAVQSLHSKVVAPIAAWRERVYNGDEEDMHEDFHFVRTRLEADHASAGLVTASSWMSHWAMLPTDEQVHETLLYLLIWGEAANLRFMPSLLCFVFEVARSCASAPEALRTERRGAPASPTDFLDRVVRPIYEEVAAEGHKNVDKDYFEFRNYDDFNEAFWSIRSIRRLRTATRSPYQGAALMDAAPPNRFLMLCHADWRAWFDSNRGGAPKRHRENVWWPSLLTANRRVFLLHAMLFAICVIVADRVESSVESSGVTLPALLDAATPPSGGAPSAAPSALASACPGLPIGQCKLQWGWLWAAPAVALIPPTFTFLGRLHEWHSLQLSRTAARCRNAFTLLALLGCLAATVWWAQAHLSFCQYRCLLFSNWLSTRRGAAASHDPSLAGLHFVGGLLLGLLSLLCFVAEAFLPAAPIGAALDAQPRFEGRVGKLGQQPLLGSIAPSLGANGRSAEWRAIEHGQDSMRQTIVTSATSRLRHLMLMPTFAPRLSGAASWLQLCRLLAGSVVPLGVAIGAFLALAMLTDCSYVVVLGASLGAALLTALCTLAAISQCSDSTSVAPALREAMRMYAFWGVVWACKLGFALVPSGVARTLVLSSRELLGPPLSALGALEATLLSWLTAASWMLSGLVFITDTLGWYQAVLALWGGVPRIIKAAGRVGSCVDVVRRALPCGDRRWSAAEARALRQAIVEKLTPASQPMAQRQANATAYLTAFVDELFREFLVSAEARRALLSNRGACGGLGAEAIRRLVFLSTSLRDPRLAPTRGAFRSPGLTVLVPSYNEAIVHQLPDVEPQAARDKGSSHLRLARWPSTTSFSKLVTLLATLQGLAVGLLVQQTAHGLLAWKLPQPIGKAMQTTGGGASTASLVWRPPALAIVAAATLAAASTGLLAAYLWWRLHGKTHARSAAREVIEAQLLQCGAEVGEAHPTARWTRCPVDETDARRNPDDADMVQAAQLELQQILEKGARKGRHVGGGADGGAEVLRWLSLPLYKPPADRAQRLSTNELAFLLGEFSDEWENFVRAPIAGRSVEGLRRWASRRMQTVFRTIDGMQKGHAALALQLSLELQGLAPEELRELMRHKHRTLWALQTFGAKGFEGQELEDVNALMAQWGGARGVAIAYLEQVGSQHYSLSPCAGP